jgi:hypothetical protein
MEYEFTVVGDLDETHNLVISKSRCSALADKVFHRPNGEVSKTLLTWLDGADAEPTTPQQPAPATLPTPQDDHAAEKKRLYGELKKVMAEIDITGDQAAAWVAENFKGQTVRDLDIFDLRAVEPGLRKAFAKPKATQTQEEITEPEPPTEPEIDF